MRLQSLPSSLVHSYDDAERRQLSAPGRTLSSPARTIRSDALTVPTGNERRLNEAEPNVEALKEALAAMQQQMEEQGVKLRFTVTSNEGEVTLEVTNETNNTLLLRLPADGLLTVGGQTPNGMLLNAHS